MLFRPRPRALDETGQASVEFVAAVPFVLLGVAVAWQIALAGWTVWLTAHAARAGARADAVGRPVRAAAASALPESMRHGLEVVRRHESGVRVQTRVPLLSPRWRGPVSVAASASLGRTQR